MEHSEKARELFLAGYNCAQSVFAAFCDETGLEEETALRLASGFGGGFGRMREMCGALSGAVMVIGMKEGGYAPEDAAGKAAVYQSVQRLVKQFQAQNGTYLCRELIAGLERHSGAAPDPRDAQYYKERPCLRFVEQACRLTEAYLRETVPSC